MKKILLIIGVVSIAFSCKKGDLLDPATSGLSPDDVFKSAQYSDQFLVDLYGQLLPVLPQVQYGGTRLRGSDMLLDLLTDNGSTNVVLADFLRNLNQGAWTSSTSTFSRDDWNSHFAAIRACNLYLANIDKVPDDAQYNFNEAIRRTRKAEAKFLLAFYYSELAKQFGGLPIVTEIISTSSNISIPRSTFDETITFIANLCDDAAKDLPLPSAQPAEEFGRATKGAALALKARVLLYAASPLWNNPKNPSDSPFNGKYDQKKWEKAAQAAHDLIALNQYQLHPELSTLFITRTNSELIFSRLNIPSSYTTSISIPTKLYPPGAYGVSGTNQVTYNMVREYEVIKNGRAYFVDDPASGHNFNEPYKDRDPRLYRDCIFNGARFQGQTAEFGLVESGGTKVVKHNTVPAASTDTYVFNTKFADRSLKITWDARIPSAGARAHQNYTYIRYAEVLLNYAEAMNEAYGPDGLGPGLTRTALSAVNEVRQRAKYENKEEFLGHPAGEGMPPIPSGLSKDELREKIRHERRVELSFEEHRFWDVRRWMVDPQTMNDIKVQVPFWKKDGSLTYEIRNLEKRGYSTRLYILPIPESEILASKGNLVQNPDW